ncbi:orotidine-5'-phosphate decarboxylase [Peptoniphilus asaccharolyticus DSM 20463]|uniref:Orotidine 5'-phosphate decarboxylase n=1 Tax=Peptoniphilus asaccharolyticus DSM 20463 TaxID=573058 RepID=A0A1W1VC46_PEPAS|nr:orotidine-5'-phosphate decarboxylase [Peptoniphilus asaccharolyticus]MBL7575680.1 orotidine-5'-phosphate decarboxylase [Peptoniphilus asaccharolyticus]SMB90631.1 orotidine-5'-phosphate decarboxylase [Peptoniphilus asaccharolyticus DSM 20463]
MSRDVIIALDFDSSEKALDFIDKFQEDEVYVKIGMELFYKAGPEIVREFKKRGHKIFLDLKLHDIPNTVKKATLSLMDLDVDMINYHIAGGSKMLMEAIKAAKEVKPEIITLGITMLTSTDEETMHNDILIKDNLSVADTVKSYAEIGKKSGLDGVVSSALEVPEIKKVAGESFITVTPGIRLEQIKGDDQKRVVTPADARMLGSDYIVVGRPITGAEDPVKAYKEIKKMFIGE